MNENRGRVDRYVRMQTSESVFIFDDTSRLQRSRPLGWRGGNHQHTTGFPVFGLQFAVLPYGVREYKIQKSSFFLGWLVLEQLVSPLD
jgi:hypothetical protein